MLLVVVLVGGAVFSTVNNNCTESSAGFGGTDLNVEDIGLDSGGELNLQLRNADSDPGTIRAIEVVDRNLETGVSSQQDIEVPVGGNGIVSVSGVSESGSCNTMDVKITYDSGGIENKIIEGQITGSFQPEPSIRPIWDGSVDWDFSDYEENTVHLQTPAANSDTIRLGYSESSEGLSSYYLFDSGTDSLEDYSGAGDGSTSGSIEKINEGMFGTPSWSFNSNNGRVKVPKEAVSGTLNEYPVTIAFWFDLNDSNNGWRNYLGWQVENATGSTFSLRTEKPNDHRGAYTRWIAETDTCGYGVDNQGFWARSSDMNVRNNGVWQLYTATYNGTHIKQYIDGVEEASSKPGCDIADMSGDLQIIGSQNDYSIDNLMFFNRSLNSSEVDRLYNASDRGELVTDWRNFEENKSASNIELKDVSAQLNGGSIEAIVHSDTDGDGEVDEISDTISLTGSGGPYPISGLSQDSRQFRLEIRLSTTDRTVSPLFRGAEVSE